MAKPQRIYWDACTWIAFIAQEKAIQKSDGSLENRFGMCREILEGAKDGQFEIVTSAFTLAEVCKNPDVNESPADALPSFFEKSYILLVPVDAAIGLRAQAMQTTGLVGLKPPDVIHLASAQRARVSQMHSFDDKILKLDGQINGADGKPLKICKPTEAEPIGPLFDEPSEGLQT